MKKSISITLFALLSIVYAQAQIQIGDLYYNLDETNLTASVATSNRSYSGDIVVPASVNYNGNDYSVTTLDFNAFRNCSEITSITLPSTLTTIKDYALFNCSALNSLSVETGNTVFDSRNNCNAIIETATNTLILGCQNTTIPTDVTAIGENAFYGSLGLTTITIPNSVTTIGAYAFNYCSALSSISIPNSVTSIGNDAFAKSALTSCSLPNGITTITKNLFFDCSQLTSVTIPSSVSSIGDYAFAKCSSLTSINIPSSVTAIGEGTFNKCTALTSITLPNSLTTIGICAFGECTALTSINIPSSVTTIGNNAFMRCTALTAITLPSSTTNLKWNIFGGCTALTSITVETTTNIIYDSRNNCNAIIETATNTLILGCSNTTVPADVTAIGEYAFYACQALSNINIPNTVTAIGEYAFAMSGLTSCNLPNGITTISESVFGGCTKLTSVTIPSSVTAIGEYAFYGCTALEQLIVEAEVPPTITSATFEQVDHTIPLYVPDQSVNDYKAATYWSDFTNILPLSTDVQNIVFTDDNNSATATKVFRNNQILILHNNKLYTLTGNRLQ